jgi:hypothetical protein
MIANYTIVIVIIIMEKQQCSTSGNFAGFSCVIAHTRTSDWA